jgi:hypothetical protein
MGSKGCCCGYVCCERLWIINNIDFVTTAQIVQFLKRGLFCYAIFSCLAIYNAAVARTNSNHELYTVKVIDAVLYCFNSAAIAYFVYYPTLLNLYIPLVSAPLLLWLLRLLWLNMLLRSLKRLWKRLLSRLFGRLLSWLRRTLPSNDLRLRGFDRCSLRLYSRTLSCMLWLRTCGLR